MAGTGIAGDLSKPDPELTGGIQKEGLSQVATSTQGLGIAALSESERAMYNARVESQNKTGVTQLASLAGQLGGEAVGGPLGGALGGMAGGMVGGAM